jgi:hypothetical protein
MEKALQVVKSREFEGKRFDLYEDGEKEFYGTREQIGTLLEYEEPMRAIAHIHERNKERLDRFSTVAKLSKVEGTRIVTRDVTVYSFKGMLEICRHSNQPKADAVMDFLYDIADEVRKSGSYSTNKAGKTDAEMDLSRKRLALQEKNANARLAKVLQRMIEHPAYPLTDDSKRVLVRDVAKLVTGESHAEILPNAVEKLYSNKEIGDEMSISNRAVMKYGRAAELVAPEGQSNEYGTWKMSKSPTSPHECAQWYWKEAGRDRIVAELREKDNVE